MKNGTISVNDLPKRILHEIETFQPDSYSTLKEVREFTEKEHIKKILEENNYRMEYSAKILGNNKTSITNKVAAYNIKTRK